MSQETKSTIEEKKMEKVESRTPGQSIRAKLLLWLLLISLVPMVVIGFAGYQYSAGSLREQSFDRMQSTLSFQRQALQSYFVEQSKNLESITENLRTLQQQAYIKLSAIRALRKKQITDAFSSMGRDAQMLAESSQQQRVLPKLKTNPEASDKRYSDFLNNWLTDSSFQSITLLGTNGNILFSTDEVIERGSKVKEESVEYQSFQKGLTGTAFTDFAPSSLLDDTLAAYLSIPVKQGGKVQGVLLLMMKISAFDQIMQDPAGLGESGESYLVGPDQLFRSNSRYFEETTLANPAFIVDTDDASDALAGNSGEKVVINYRGEYVFSSYAPVDIFGTTWALIVEIEQTEAITPKLVGKKGNYLTQIVDNYGYPDLYLLSPDGYIVASAKQKSDYLTHILSGPYSDSAFAATIAKVIETKDIVVSDYSRYEPAGTAPAAFLAKPIKEGATITMIVGLQIPIDRINTIVNIQGESGEEQSIGETYLVGQDKLWRTESEQADKYKVKSTLLNPEMLTDTKAVNGALAGETGTEIITNVAGETVLSSWAPFTYQDLKWAMISEVSQEQVEKPITGLLTIVIFTAFFVLAAVVLVSLIVSGGVTRQVSQIMNVMTKVGKGDYGDRVEITSKDELGDMANSFNQTIDTIQSLIKTRQEEHDQLQSSIIRLLEEITQLADGDLSIRASVSEDETGTIADSLNLMLEELGLAIGKIKESSGHVGNTANQLSSSTSELAARSDTQSSMINEAVEEINRLTSAIEQAAIKADQSAVTSKVSSQVAGDGAKAVEDTSRAMEAIRGNVQDTARAIKRLGESSQEISDFTKIINEISDRTSILALNASIQAAAAGEEGRGFAVVAEEIQRLAERAASSTRQIETLIKNILDEITEAGTSMDASIQEVVNGTSLSKNALSRLHEITGRSNEVADLISTVAAASKEQADTTAKLAKTMGKIGSESLETAGQTRNASSTMQQMAKMADEMLQSVAEFKLAPEEKIDAELIDSEVIEKEDSKVIEDVSGFDDKAGE